MKFKRWRGPGLGFAGLALAACVGSVGTDSASDDGDSSDGSRPNPETDPDPARCKGIDPGPSPLRRLVRTHYNSTVEDLVGDTTRPAFALPPEEAGGGFSHNADALGVSTLLARGYYDVARGIAERAAADPARWSAILGCDPVKIGERACAQSFIGSFGRRAFRRPLDAEEEADLLAVYEAVRPAHDFRSAAEAVMTVMLQSPQFLYRIEAGMGDDVAPDVDRPTHHEMASRLSYLLWGTMPDETLFRAADEGRLGARDEVRAQAERMLAHPRGRKMVATFHGLLFRLDGLDGIKKPAALYPKYFAGLGSLLRQEGERFIEHVLWEGPGDLETLFTAPYSFMNRELARYYGVSGPSGETFEQVSLPASRSAGILTTGGLMAALTPGDRSDPTLRGVYVRKDLLCRPPPDVPADLVASGAIKPVSFDNVKTTREVYEQHASDPLCAGCHRLMDPIGYGFENFDGLGLWRDSENGKPIDPTGEIVGDDLSPETRGSFVGPVELAQRLATSPDVRGCLVNHWLTHAYARPLGDARDACTRAKVKSVFAASGYRIPDLVLALTETDAFLYLPARESGGN
jgi:hypothetical protein